MPRFIQGLIFDLDGTLIDSRADIVGSVNHALEKLGLRELPSHVISSYVGDGVRNLLTDCLSHFSRPDLLESGTTLFRQHYGVHLLDHTRLYPGVSDVLRWLHPKLKAVVTNKPEGFTIQILQGLGIRSYFDQVLGGDSLPVKKPSPEPIFKVLQSWNFAPSDVLVLGDSANDMQAGKKARTLTCAVTYGFRSRTELESSRPDWIIDSITQLKDLVG